MNDAYTLHLFIENPEKGHDLWICDRKAELRLANVYLDYHEGNSYL